MHNQQLWLDFKNQQFYDSDRNCDIRINGCNSTLQCNSIPVRKIQNIAVFVNNKVASLSLDSGCEGDCITIAECQRLGISVTPLSPSDRVLPTQADGKSPLKVLGKA